MTVSPLLKNHIEAIVRDLPRLSGVMVDETLEHLRSSGLGLAIAQDRRHFFSLMESVQRQRSSWAEALERRLAARIRDEVQAGAPTPAHASPRRVRFDELTLVDERQAEEDIEISRTIALIDDGTEWELRGYIATLRGETEIRSEDNPLRPEVYARALNEATHEIAVPPDARLLLQRTAGGVLARTLKHEYAQLSQRLRQQRVEPVAFRAVAQARAMPEPAPGLDITVPGVMGRLLDKVRATAPAPLDGSHPTAQAASPATMVGRLYSQILADPRLMPPVKGLMGRLQPSVERVAERDPSLLQRHDHPAWQLLNRVAAHCAGYPEAGDPRLAEFLRFLDTLVARVGSTRSPDSALYRRALDEVNHFIDQRGREALAHAQAAIDKLQRIERAEQLRGVLRQQLRQTRGAVVGETLRDFLFGPWIDVVVESMARHGEASTEAMDLQHVVDELLSSLQPPRTPADGDRVRATLPALVARLQKGMDLAAMPQEARIAVLDDLRRQHISLLQAGAKPAAEDERDLTPEEIVRRMREEPDPPPFSPEEGVDRGSLPTVPVALLSQEDTEAGRLARDAWLARLVRGSWYHMFVQGHWITAQLMWTSENGQFLVFENRDAEHAHSLTRRAIERLLAEGLVTVLEERSLMQRAVDSLIQDLDGPLA